MLHSTYSIDYSSHGSNWGFTSNQCASGNQSPINLYNPVSISEEDANYWYLNVEGYISQTFNKNLAEVKGNYLNLTSDFGQAVKMYPNSANNTIGDAYTAQFILFHSPSEHMISGNRSDLEIQIYHTSETSGNLVLSVLLDRSNNTEDFQKFLSDVENANKSSKSIDPVDVVDGYYEVKNFYRYKGSYTFPNCDAAEWVIVSQKRSVYSKYIDPFISFLSSSGGNYREIQNNTTLNLYDGKTAIDSSAALVVGIIYLLI